ncbi:MAG TPA: threonine synthase [Acidimicrobiia bacterium]|nr:threonine synthase [Acidimicrobiia bacterium]
MAFAESLICRECSRTYELGALYYCEHCFGPLEVAYDTEAVAAHVSRENIAAGPPTLWRYADMLPVEPTTATDLGAGFTPLVRADRLAAELGLGELWLKNDSLNPTNSFKDRPVTVALAKALEFGLKTVACASTGNLANSVAAHAARAGLGSYVFVPHDIEPSKIVATAALGTVVRVDGTYDDVNRLCSQLDEEYSWGIVNVNLRPYYAEGSKTLAFETAEQLGWELPDHVVVPVASGALLTKIAKGFRELVDVGLVEPTKPVRISGAQAEGCSPVAVAFAEGTDDVRPQKPDTIAKSLAIGDPADGFYSLREVRASGGAVAAVSDAEIVDAMRTLARTEGILTEPAGGVTVATLAKLAAEGRIGKSERVVAYITGHGLKTPEVFDSGTLEVIPATVGGFQSAYENKE